MTLCLICKRPLEIASNHIEQVKKKKRGVNLVDVCHSCQAKILFEAKNKQKNE